MNEMRMSFHKKSEEELARLEQQMKDYREKSKKKVNDLVNAIQEN